MKNNPNSLIRFVIPMLIASMVGWTGCSTLSNTEKGAAAGSGVGAVVGGAIGKAKGSTAKGAVAGAIIGGAAGALIGKRMDKQARDLKKAMPDADVERVDEGIIVTMDSGILFGFDSDELSSRAREDLRDLASSLNEYDDTDLTIIGHTDAVGSDGYNLDLSRRRARSASNFLKANGIHGRRISVVGKGELEPVATNESETGRMQNRRVEVAIRASDEAIQAAQSSQ